MTYTLLSCIDSKIIHTTNFYGKFELGPFSSGQSLSIANTLRRGLLSELPGTAITLVKIIGTSHEYDTISGIRECTLDLLLNLKKLILKADFDFYTPQIGFLNIKGPGVVRARDLNLPFFIYSIDPDQYIATLTTNGKLNMTLLINCGKTYLTHNPSSKHYNNWINLLNKNKPSALVNLNQKGDNDNTIYQQWKTNNQTQLASTESFMLSTLETNQINLNANNFNLKNHKKNDFLKSINETETKQINQNNESELNFEQTKTNKIGYFPINANFSPIIRVNYTIELKNHLTNQETLFLELWTNGTIDPRSAIHKTVKKLIQLFLPLQQIKTSFFSDQTFTNSMFFKKKKYQKNVTKNSHFFNTPNSGLLLKRMNTPSHLILKSRLKDLTKLNDLFVLKTNKIKTIKKQNQCSNLEQMHVRFKKKFLYLDISNLALSPKLYFLLKKVNIHKIQDLILTSKQQFLEIPNFKLSYFIEIEQILKNYKSFLRRNS
jgi:DNA-directed RNA polymerase alpha subunit